jgi:hypothetical protein
MKKLPNGKKKKKKVPTNRKKKKDKKTITRSLLPFLFFSTSEVILSQILNHHTQTTAPENSPEKSGLLFC